jgi:putative Holliday junction resolvase
VELWDESGSTQAARASQIALGVSRRKRGGHLDEIAAAVILQSYLDAHYDRTAGLPDEPARLDDNAGKDID